MEIRGKVYCFFEQSGTFKNEFIKLGIPAEDYDIQNNFGQTNHQIDLFNEIETAYGGGISIFDTMSCDDLILAFFPCIYFCTYAEFNMRQTNAGMKKWSIEKQWEWKLEFGRNRHHFFELALKMCALAEIRGLRLIMENPWNEVNYTNYHWFRKPTLIDKNRQMRGDYFHKPTAYWFYGCQPTNGMSYQTPKETKRIVKYGTGPDVAKGSSKSGLCSEERSMISPDYARNFICDFILGKPQKETQLNLF